MYVPGQNKSANTHIRARLRDQRTPLTATSHLRSHDETNVVLDKVIGLCAGRASRDRIMRMQEGRIIKLLSGSPPDDFEIARRSTYEKITELARVIKRLGIGSEESIEPQKQYDALVDSLIDNPFQVFVPACDTNLMWADLEGGSITGTRETLNLRSPWQEPNFGIKFHYRHGEEDVEPPRGPVLPGARSLYGGQWYNFERTSSFCQFYDPRPYDPDPSPCGSMSTSPLSAPIETSSPVHDDVLFGSDGVEPENNEVSQNPHPQRSLRPEPQKHQRHRSVSFVSLSSSVHTDMNTDLHDITEKPEILEERIPTTVTMTGHTIAPFQYQSRHLNCFPDIAHPPPKRGVLNLELACAEYKAYGDSRKAQEEDVAAKSSKVASELNIPPMKDDNTETPAWQVKREECELRNMRRAAEDHRMAASPRAEEQGYNARRMSEEEKRRLIEEQKQRIQALNAQGILDAEEEVDDQELINRAILAQDYYTREYNRKLQARIARDAKEEEMRKIAEQQRLAREALLAEQHRKAAFKVDSGKSFLGANAAVLAEGAPAINTSTRNIEMSEVVAREMGVPEINIIVQVLSQAVDTLNDDGVPNVDMAALVLRIAQKHGVREEDVATAVLAMAETGAPNMDGALRAIVLAQNQKRAAARTNVTVPKAQPRVFFRERETKRRGPVFKNAAVLERERLALEKAKAEAEAEQEIWAHEAAALDGSGDEWEDEEADAAGCGDTKETRDSPSTVKNKHVRTAKKADAEGSGHIKETRDSPSTVKNSDVRTAKAAVAETKQPASKTKQVYTEVTTALNKIKTAVCSAANSAGVCCCHSPGPMPSTAQNNCHATSSGAADSCAIDSDSDSDDDEWDPFWMVDQRYEKKPNQYSPGGTRLD